MPEVTMPPEGAAADPLEAGRAALARHDWHAAFERLTEADAAMALSGSDLESLATAAYFAGEADIELEVKERAVAAHLAEGDQVRAAHLALEVARDYFYTGRQSISAGWLRRAERLLPPEGDTYAHGFLTIVRSEMASAAGDIDTALELAERAIAIGERAADADLKAHALTNLGTLKIATGETADGLAMMEEASIAAVNGELSPFTAGITTCRMISTCRDLTDYRKATEWIEQTEKYCRRQDLSGFPGICRIHRAEITAISGEWELAERELERATTELERYHAAPPQADGYYAIGDIRRLKGEFAEAETALREAVARGRSAHPALALIRLAQGKAKAALAAIDAAVSEAGFDRWARARLLPAQVEIAIAAGETSRARAAVDLLSEIVATYPSPAMDAGRQVALARVLVAEGDAAEAAASARAAIRSWREVGAPYEIARARAVLASALRAIEDDEDADVELRIAHDEFERLGARIDAAAAAGVLRDEEERRTGPATIRRTFMFTDIVDSTGHAERLGDAAWAHTLRWHDDTLRRLIADGGGEVVNSTGDGFFAAFESGRAAVDCAISIQRALREHRTRTRYPAQVRIGLHAADASRRGGDYSGVGVHVAARVGALATAEQILATDDVIAEAGDVPRSDQRAVTVKGVTGAIRIATIDWD
jgi:class 3 adenylate cyclase/ATP/maltotriose-dependent transcriptional regulator MalT